MALTPRDIVFPEIPCDGDLHIPYTIVGKPDEVHTLGEDGFWAKYQEQRHREWREIVAAYEADPDDLYNSWRYLDNHPAFWVFSKKRSDSMAVADRVHEKNLETENGIHRCVLIAVAKVNPATRETEDEIGKARETEVWIELGRHSWPQEPGDDPNRQDSPCHDHLLGCGAPTLDAAIVKAARNVHDTYGNDRRICDAPYDIRNYAAVLKERP